jgi:hypothetical protein
MYIFKILILLLIYKGKRRKNKGEEREEGGERAE